MWESIKEHSFMFYCQWVLGTNGFEPDDAQWDDCYFPTLQIVTTTPPQPPAKTTRITITTAMTITITTLDWRFEKALANAASRRNLTVLNPDYQKAFLRLFIHSWWWWWWWLMVLELFWSPPPDDDFGLHPPLREFVRLRRDRKLRALYILCMNCPVCIVTENTQHNNNILCRAYKDCTVGTLSLAMCTLHNVHCALHSVHREDTMTSRTDCTAAAAAATRPEAESGGRGHVTSMQCTHHVYVYTIHTAEAMWLPHITYTYTAHYTT